MHITSILSRFLFHSESHSHHSSLSLPLSCSPSISPPLLAATAPGPPALPSLPYQFPKGSFNAGREQAQCEAEGKRGEWIAIFLTASLRGEPDWTLVFCGGGGRGVEEAGGGTEGRAGQMEGSSQHLEHCAVDMRELSAIPEGLTAGELTTPCPSVCRLICPRWSSFLSFLKSLNMFFSY